MIGVMELPVPDRTRRYTVEEYFAICETADVKYEYRDGELVPLGGWERDGVGRVLGMAGGTFEHGEIACNLIAGLKARLAGRPCRVNNSDVRVRIPRSGRYLLPDVSVTCGAPLFDPPDQRLTLVNPQVLIEVLSPSTANYDTTEKLTDYIGIDSLQDYVVFAQNRPRAATFYRQPDGIWAIGPWAEGLDVSVTFPSLGVTVPLAEVYAGIEFPPPPSVAIV